MAHLTLMQRLSPLVIDYLLLVLLAAIFGISFTLNRIVVAEYPPATTVFLRLAMALLALLVYMLIRQHRFRLSWDLWGWLLASAAFGYALPFGLIVWGQEQVDAGVTAVFMAIMPLITILIAHVVTPDERLTVRKLVGVALGFLGVLVLMGQGRALVSLSLSPEAQVIRQLAILGGATCYAINAIITRKLVLADKLSVLVVLLFLSTAMMLPAMLLESPVLTAGSSTIWLALVLLALGPTLTGALLILVIIDRSGASFFSQINFLVPIAGVMFGILLLGESLTSRVVVALLLVMSGIALNRSMKRQPSA